MQLMWRDCSVVTSWSTPTTDSTFVRCGCWPINSCCSRTAVLRCSTWQAPLVSRLTTLTSKFLYLRKSPLCRAANNAWFRVFVANFYNWWRLVILRIHVLFVLFVSFLKCIAFAKDNSPDQEMNITFTQTIQQCYHNLLAEELPGR